MLRPSAALVLLLASSVPAIAQTDADRERARALLETGAGHYDAGRYEASAASYHEAHAALVAMGNERAPLALWNAGQALAEVPGREADAIATLQRFLDTSHDLVDDVGVRDDRSHALGLIAELSERAPEAPSSADPTPPAPPVETGPVETVSPIGPVVLGVGGLMLAIGAVLGGVALSDGDQLRTRCADGRCPSSEADAVADLRALSIAADVLLFGGAAIAAVGLVVTLTLFDRDERPVARLTPAAGRWW